MVNKFIRALWGGKTLPKGEEIGNPIITTDKKKKVVNEQKGNEFKLSYPILTCKWRITYINRYKNFSNKIFPLFPFLSFSWQRGHDTNYFFLIFSSYSSWILVEKGEGNGRDESLNGAVDCN